MHTIHSLHNACNELDENMIAGRQVLAYKWACEVSEIASLLASEIDAGKAYGLHPEEIKVTETPNTQLEG